MSTATATPTTTRADVTAKIMAMKVAEDWKWEDLAELTGQNPVWTAATGRRFPILWRSHFPIHDDLPRRK